MIENSNLLPSTAPDRSSMFDYIVDPFVNLFAFFIRHVRINRVSFSKKKADGNEIEVVTKKRSPLSWVLIGLGNVVLKRRIAPVEVLPIREWIAWEQTVKQLTRGEHVSWGPVLVTEKIPGLSLATILQQARDQPDRQRAAIMASVQALFQLHQMSVPVIGIGDVLFSHADATVHNVLYEHSTGTAEWIDFDLRHDLNIEPRVRQADDLRAYLFSLVGYCVDRDIRALLEVVRQEYETRVVWHALQSQLLDRRFRLDVFHRSQTRRTRGMSAPCSPSEFANVSLALKKAIAEMEI